MAIADGIDMVQWARVRWYDVLPAEFAPHILYLTDQFLTHTPFNREEEPIWVGKSCHFCGPSRMIGLAIGVWPRECIYADGWGGTGMRSIVLADCLNAYAAVGPISVNSTDRPMRILLSYVRVALISRCFSFLGAIFNLPDVATETHDNQGTYSRLISTGHFLISLLGRGK